MAQQSARRGWENQGFPQCFEHALGDLDLARELPYRPAADHRCTTGRTDGSIRLRAPQSRSFPLPRGGRSLIAPPLSIASFFLLLPPRGHGSLRGRKGPPQHLVRSTGAAMSTTGSHGIVCGPRPTCAAACTLAPSGNHHIRGDAPDGSGRDSSGGYRLLGPAEWLARAPDAVHDHGEFPGKRYARLACT